MNSAKVRPVIVAIGGSDSAAMAGIQMDLRVAGALGCHAATVISAVTAQNSRTVMSINPVADDVFADQLRACRELAPAAIKIGLLATPSQVGLCAEFVAGAKVPVVLDPVLASSSGTGFVDETVRASLIRHLLPLCTLVTPNRSEAELLSEGKIEDTGSVISAATRLYAYGETAVVVKGGHGLSARSNDYCVTPGRSFWLVSERQLVRNARGTGCAFATAAASALARGYALEDGLVIAKMAVNQGLRQGYACGEQEGPIRVDHFPDELQDLPILVDSFAGENETFYFPRCGPEPLGLYPVVDSSRWLERLLPQGVTTIQLRIKDMEAEALREEIRRSVSLSRQYGARLFINDHWRMAIEEGAYGVHLGQEDLASTDLGAIHRAGLRLGISTHCHYEVARALAHNPSYLACGPVYATTSKIMPWVPHQLAGLRYWSKVLGDYPLVAIGGINGERLAAVVATGADGIAMISAITAAKAPEATATAFRGIIAEARHGG